MKITGLIVSSGHTNVKGKDVGASSKDGKYVEGFLTVEAKNILAKHFKEACQKEGLDYSKYLLLDRDDTALVETMSFLKGRTKPTDVLIDIHFNAANGVAKGTEVLVPNGASVEELEIADRISDIFGNTLGTPERGVIKQYDGVKAEADSNRGSLGWMRLTGINILIEVEFLDNKAAMAIYDSKKEECWKLVAYYITGLIKQSI